MTQVLALTFNLALCWLTGRGALRLLFPKQKHPGSLVFLCGYFFQTMILFATMTLGAPFATSAICLAGAVAFAELARLGRGGFAPALPRGLKPGWEALAALALVLSAAGFALWFADRVPVISDDALTAWAGRARALYHGVMFSMDPGQWTFMGASMGPADYPLSQALWTASTAVYGGEFGQIVSRSGSLCGFLALAWAVWDAGVAAGSRRLALAGVVFLLCLPFVFWQTVSGYADIMSGAFGAGGMLALALGNPFLAGLMGAGAAWVKNDGLFLVLPALALGSALLPWSREGWSLPRAMGDFARCCLGASFLAPWLAYKMLVVAPFVSGDADQSRPVLYMIMLAVVAAVFILAWVWRRYDLAALRVSSSLRNILTGAALFSAACVFLTLAWRTAGSMDISYHPQALRALWDLFFTGPTHLGFWLFAALCLAASAPRLIRDAHGRAMLAALSAMFLVFLFLFTCTRAFEYLVIQTTVHRVGAGFYGACLCVCLYGAGVKADKSAA